ncbi:MAG: hypothetical protein HC849_09485 [Oscillatoriales cyanobacterium RU_3_3]|nr:hypothetical protein [Oscillatoriales cyanobacterium RU_3_3]
MPDRLPVIKTVRSRPNNCQLSTVNYQLSTVNCQLSTINYQLFTRSHRAKHF